MVEKVGRIGDNGSPRGSILYSDRGSFSNHRDVHKVVFGIVALLMTIATPLMIFAISIGYSTHDDMSLGGLIFWMVMAFLMLAFVLFYWLYPLYYQRGDFNIYENGIEFPYPKNRFVEFKEMTKIEEEHLFKFPNMPTNFLRIFTKDDCFRIGDLRNRMCDYNSREYGRISDIIFDQWNVFNDKKR